MTRRVCLLQRPEVEKSPFLRSYHASFHHLLILEFDHKGRGKNKKVVIGGGEKFSEDA